MGISIAHLIPVVLVDRRIRLQGGSTRRCTHHLGAALEANPTLFLRHHLRVDQVSPGRAPKVWTTMHSLPNTWEKTPTAIECPVIKTTILRYVKIMMQTAKSAAPTVMIPPSIRCLWRKN